LEQAQGDPSRLGDATDLFDRLIFDDDCAEFLTLRAYVLLAVGWVVAHASA
jgi:hypothetical protein